MTLESPQTSDHPRFPHLFRPFTLKGVPLRNRVAVSAHFAGWWVDHGLPDRRVRAYLEERAKGGIGLFVIGATAPRFERRPGWMQNIDDRDRPTLPRSGRGRPPARTPALRAALPLGCRPLPGVPVVAGHPAASAIGPGYLRAGACRSRPPRSVEELESLVSAFGDWRPPARGQRRSGRPRVGLPRELPPRPVSSTPYWNQRDGRVRRPLGEPDALPGRDAPGAIRAAIGPDCPSAPPQADDRRSAGCPRRLPGVGPATGGARTGRTTST